jgi:hypothetical protein
MRVWKRLQTWVAEEADSRARPSPGRICRALAAGPGRPVPGSELELALNWRRESAPNPAWGLRYHDGFGTAMAFTRAQRTSTRDRPPEDTSATPRRFHGGHRGSRGFFLLWRYAVGRERLARSQARAVQAEQRPAPVLPASPRIPGRLLLRLAHELAATPLTTAVLRNATFRSRLGTRCPRPQPTRTEPGVVEPSGTRILTACSTNARLGRSPCAQAPAPRAVQAHTDSDRS